MPEYSPELLWACLFATLLTLVSKILPLGVLNGDSLPKLLKNWLDFVPVAVMGALVGPDMCIYNGKLDLSTSNLFLMVSIPTFLVAWKTRNFFITIASGIALVIISRFFGIA